MPPKLVHYKRRVTVETKGIEDLGVPLKMARLKEWCNDINNYQNKFTYDFIFVDEDDFKKYEPNNFQALFHNFRRYKDD